MEWHWRELRSILHHLPHAVGHVLHHEDAALVKVGLPGIALRAPLDTGPRIVIEKDMDPSVARSEQNLGLLLHDYLHYLPQYDASTKEAEELLEHWRKIIAQQPQRLATARQSYWNSEHAKQFWQDRIGHYRAESGIAADGLPELADAWERVSGAEYPVHPAMSPDAKARQWEDLVIRNRMHKLTMAKVQLG